MIVVGGEGGGVRQPGGTDDKAVVVFFRVDAGAPQLGDRTGDTIAFLVTDEADAVDPGG